MKMVEDLPQNAIMYKYLDEMQMFKIYLDKVNINQRNSILTNKYYFLYISQMTFIQKQKLIESLLNPKQITKNLDSTKIKHKRNTLNLKIKGQDSRLDKIKESIEDNPTLQKMVSPIILGIMQIINKSCTQIINIFDKLVELLNRIANKLGENGYLFYGFFASSLFFVAVTSLKFIPKVDWSICYIIRGVSNYLFGLMACSIYQKDTSFAGNNLYYVNQRNILMGLHQLFLQYALVVLPISIVWVISNSSPLFVFIVNYFMFSASLTPKQIMFLLISLFGVCLITNPGIYQGIINFIKNSFNYDQQQATEEENKNNLEKQESSLVNYISILFLLTQIIFAYSVSIIKKATNINSISILLHLGIVFIAIGSFALFYRIDNISMPSIHDIVLVFIFFGIGSFFPSLIFIQGTIIAKCQGRYSLTVYINVFYSYLFEIFYENKIPQLPELVGIFLAFYGLYRLMVK